MGLFWATSPFTSAHRQRLEQSIAYVNEHIPNSRQQQLGALASNLMDPLWIGNSRLGMSEVRLSLQTGAMISTSAWIALNESKSFAMPKGACIRLGESFAVMEFGNYLNQKNLMPWVCDLILSPQLVTTVTMIVDVAYGSKDLGPARKIVEDYRFAGGLCAFGPPERSAMSLDSPAEYLQSIKNSG